MTTEHNPMVDRFRLEMTDSALSKKLNAEGRHLHDLPRCSTDEARMRLATSFAEIVIATKPLLATVRKLFERALLCSTEFFPNHQGFLQRLYSPEPKVTALLPTCVTGLSGVGKSVIINCFNRLCSEATIEIPGHGRFVLAPTWSLTPQSGAGIRQILLPKMLMTNPDASRRSGDVMLTARAEIARLGVALVTTDEFQFLTLGSANTHVAKTLMQLSRLGPPLVYVANFSLLHKLVQRPQEERQRLLSNVIMVHADRADSDDWRSLVGAFFRIAPEFGRLNIAVDGCEIHRYTHGLKRLVAQLLSASYVAMREREGKYVNSADIKNAYLSLDYSAARVDVEDLAALEFKPNLRGRSDLWSPLKGQENPSSRLGGTVVPHPATARYELRAAEELVVSSMTAAERSAYRDFHPTNSPSLKTDKPQRRPRPPVTAENLMKGAESFRPRNRIKE